MFLTTLSWSGLLYCRPLWRMRSWSPLRGWMSPLNRWTYISCWGQFPYNPYKFFSLENLPIQISTEVSQYISYSRKSSHLKVFSLARDAEFGRFVVANKDLGVGDTVMEGAGLNKKMEWTAFCGLCGLTKPKAMEWTVIGGLFGLTKEMEWTAFCGLNSEEDWVNCNFVQERPLSWAPMLDSPPICLNCAKFLQKKSYRSWMN